jgi:hypothetical protein
VWGEEARQGEDHVAGAEAGRTTRGIFVDDFDPVRFTADVGDEIPQADPIARRAGKVGDQVAVPLGPGEKLGRLPAIVREPCREVVHAGPGRGLRERGPEVVSAAVLDEPAQPGRAPAALLHVLRHGQAIERPHLGRIRAAGARNREGPPSGRISPRRPAAHLRLELGQLPQVVGAGAVPRVETLVPLPAVEEPLLWLAAEDLLGPNRVCLPRRDPRARPPPPGSQ